MRSLEELYLDLCRDMHESWVREKIRQGYVFGERTDDRARVHKDIKPFSELSPQNIEMELGVVRDIVALLKEKGYDIAIGTATSAATHVAIDERRRAELFEVLCREVHESWMRTKVMQGYVFGEITVDALKTHCDLKPYAELSGEKRALDAAVVGAILTGIESRGYLIVVRK
jgi:hypothetical protein